MFFESAPARPDQILPHMLMNMNLPALMVGLFCAGGLAASMSSGDAMAHAAASIAVRDGLVKALGVSLTPERERRTIRYALLGIVILSYALSVTYRNDLVPLLLAAYGPVTQFAPVVYATLFWRRATPVAALSALLAGAAVQSIFYFFPQARPFPLHPGLYGLVVNATVLILVSLVTSRRSDEWDERFLRVAGGRS